MLNLKVLESASSEVTRGGKAKDSQVKQDIIALVKAGYQAKKPITISLAVKALGKKATYGSYVRLLVSKSKELHFEKVNGVNVIELSA
jgi:hypothetical protein